jgi:8-oxo-dGTP pyrophosphatase MutT (NUDIX family)
MGPFCGVTRTPRCFEFESTNSQKKKKKNTDIGSFNNSSNRSTDSNGSNYSNSSSSSGILALIMAFLQLQYNRVGMTNTPLDVAEETSGAIWRSFPLHKRAAVLVLVLPSPGRESNNNHSSGSSGFSTLLTTRAHTLKTSPGLAAFPGGKADSLDEDEWQCALREAAEEIGFDPANAPGFRRLGTMPCYLSYNDIAVRPCVAAIDGLAAPTSKSNAAADELVTQRLGALLAPAVHASEVNCVFLLPLERVLERGAWYAGGTPMPVRGHGWIFHDYAVPVRGVVVVARAAVPTGTAATRTRSRAATIILQGLTGHIVSDVARLVLDTPPEMEVLAHIGSNRIAREYYQKKSDWKIPL